MGNLNMNNVKLLNTIETFKELKPDWDGYGANSISLEVIENAKTFLNNFNNSENFEVFPTALGTILFESKTDNPFITYEIFKDKIETEVTEKEGEDSITSIKITRLK
jgi:hypothetical protein